MKKLLFVLILSFAVFGCSEVLTREQVAAVKESSIVLEARLEQARDLKAKADDLVARLPEGSARERAEKISKEMGRVLEQVQPVLSHVNTAVADATDDIDLLSGAVSGVAPLLPPPYGQIALVGSGLLAGLLRAWRVKNAATKVIRAIETVKTEDGKVDFAASADELSKLMGDAGVKLVDEAQGTKKSLPI